MTIEYINQKSKEINQYAIRKGFWTPERSLEEKLMMVITEISEAVEADRNNKRADLNQYIKLKESYLKYKRTLRLIPFTYECCIKNKVEEEFADIAIRLLDLVAHFKIDVDNCDFFNIPEDMQIQLIDFNKYSFAENALYLVQLTCPASPDLHEHSPILATLSELIRWAKHLEIDLPYHIDEKLNYLKSLPNHQVKKY